MGDISRERLESILQMLLQSTFRYSDIKIVHNALDIVMSRIEGTENLCAPYKIALEYLESNKDPAILENQHLEMRDAANVLIDLFDRSGMEES